jgi:hypothetical protein
MHVPINSYKNFPFVPVVSIYRQYIFLEYLVQHSLKLKSTKYYFKAMPSNIPLGSFGASYKKKPQNDIRDYSIGNKMSL